jgi:hypothetical protein
LFFALSSDKCQAIAEALTEGKCCERLVGSMAHIMGNEIWCGELVVWRLGEGKLKCVDKNLPQCHFVLKLKLLLKLKDAGV